MSPMSLKKKKTVKPKRNAGTLQKCIVKSAKRMSQLDRGGWMQRWCSRGLRQHT